MKKIFVCIAALAAGFSGTVYAQTASKTLVVYFSRTDENYGVGVIAEGNTAVIAKMIAEETGADLFEVKPVEKYPASYRACTEVARKELAENARPAIIGDVDNFDRYDTVFIGYPNWWGDLPMCMYTFLENHSFDGKTVIPFATHEGSGLGNTERAVARTCSGAARQLKGLAVTGRTAQNRRSAAKESVTKWLKEIGVTE